MTSKQLESTPIRRRSLGAPAFPHRTWPGTSAKASALGKSAPLPTLFAASAPRPGRSWAPRTGPSTTPGSRRPSPASPSHVPSSRAGIFVSGGGELLHQFGPGNCARFRRGHTREVRATEAAVASAKVGVAVKAEAVTPLGSVESGIDIGFHPFYMVDPYQSTLPLTVDDSAVMNAGRRGLGLSFGAEAYVSVGEEGGPTVSAAYGSFEAQLGERGGRFGVGPGLGLPFSLSIVDAPTALPDSRTRDSQGPEKADTESPWPSGQGPWIPGFGPADILFDSAPRPVAWCDNVT
jgi:hypothetical protein